MAQRHLDRSQTLRRDKAYDTRQEKESEQRLQNDGRSLQERKADDRERTKEEVDRFQQDVSSAAEERRTTAEDKVYAKEQAETIANDKADHHQAQVRTKAQVTNDNLISDRALEAQRRSYERQKELHGRASGSPKDQDDLLPKDGTGDLPEGVSERPYELGNKIVIERTVKVGNKVDVYKKVVSKAGTYYFKTTSPSPNRPGRNPRRPRLTMRFLILNGPNLNLLGTREPEIYGSQTFDDVLAELRAAFPGQQLDYAQSNVEGELINHLHDAGFSRRHRVQRGRLYAHFSGH